MTPMLFDTHAHYDDEAFDADRDALLVALPQQGVALVVNPGCDPASSQKAVELARAWPFLYAAVGWHPEDCAPYAPESLDELRALAREPKVVAIGEIGLDYYWKENPPRALQQNVFRRQMELAQSLHLKPMDGDHAGLYTNGGKPLPAEPEIQAITFSGGVADCVYQKMEGDLFRYGDIGVLLGQAIRENPDLRSVQLFQAAETIRATVVGAGEHTTEVSGSTIHYAEGKLPIKNIPILKVSEEDEASLETFRSSITHQMPLYQPEGEIEQIAIAFNGEKRTSFAEVQKLAAAIIDAAKEVIASKYPLILVVEADIGKVLGNALNVLLDYKKDVICIDGIKTLSGDYVDIGEPVAEGHVVPVVIKTLIFNS